MFVQSQERALEKVFFLIAVWNTYETRPLVNDQVGQPYGKGRRNKNDDDQIDRMRKQATSCPQGPDDRPASSDPRRHREQEETKREEHPGEIIYFRVQA